MLAMFRDLIAHKAEADAALLGAIRQSETARSDPEISELLHHMLLANRFWVLTVRGLPFVLEEEARKSNSFESLIDRYRSVHAEESAWFATATEADLARRLDNPFIPGGGCSVAQAFMQVCLHSHGHRAQCAKMLRRHGGVPPATDFINWLANSQR